MRALISTRGVVVFVVVALLAATAAGCGGSSGDSGGSSASATLAAGQSADQIVKDAEAKMATVKSASFTADLALEVQGDASKMSDATAKAMLSQGLTFQAKGASAQDPTAVDMTMSVGIAGQTLEFAMKAKGKKSWIEYQGTWYALDSDNAKQLDQQASSGVTPTEQLKSLGIDPSTWGTTYEYVGSEDLSGVQVYHVKAVADPQKLADSLTAISEDKSLQKELGGDDSELGQLGQSLTQDNDQVKELAKSLKDATVDFWIGVDDQYIYKTQIVVDIDTSSQKDMKGVTGMSLKGTATMADFGAPVEVTAPKNAKSFDAFTTELFGGMMGGGNGLSL